MIEINIDPNNQSIHEVIFNFDDVQISDITLKYLQIRIFNDDKNISGILEKFRKSNAEKIEPAIFKYIIDTINESKTDLSGFNPSHIIVLKSKNDDIANLIKALSENIKSHNEFNAEDVSDCFIKESSTSITTYKEATDEFIDGYQLNEEFLKKKYFSKLLIVDDAYKKGRTINQLLIRLVKNKNIDRSTKILIYSIYSFC